MVSTASSGCSATRPPFNLAAKRRAEVGYAGLAHGFADADAELAVDTLPEAVAQPRAGLLVGAQRLAQLLLRLDEQLFVDHRRQNRAWQQVADMFPAPFED